MNKEGLGIRRIDDNVLMDAAIVIRRIADATHGIKAKADAELI